MNFLKNLFKKYRKAVFVVVYKKQNKKIKYLVLKRKLHWKGWEFPKGGKKKDEIDKLTIKREVKEETGQIPFDIEYHNKKGKYLYDKQIHTRKNIKGQTYKLYSAQVPSSKVKMDKKEHETYKWLLFKDALKILTWENQKQCLKIVDKDLKKQ